MRATPPPAQLVHQLRTLVGPAGVLTGPQLANYERDFGNQLRRCPAVVVRPVGEAALGRVLHLLHTWQQPFRIRGQAHSAGGHTLLARGIVVQPVGAEQEPSLNLADQTAWLPAACTWRTVLQALHPAGVTVPVLTSHLATTVGGTLSAGGYGLASGAAGAQVDHVLAVRVVLASGQLATYRPGDPAFAQVLTGMGQAGVITAAQLRTRRWLPWAKLARWELPALTDVAAVLAAGSPADFRQLPLAWAETDGHRTWLTLGTQHPDHLAALLARVPVPPGLAARPTPRIELCPTASLYDYGEDNAPADREPAAEGEAAAHYWSDFGLSGAVLADYLALLERVILPTCADLLSRVHLLPIQPGATAFAHDLRAPGSAAMTFGVGVYLTARSAAERRRAASIRARLLRFARARGGRPYLPGCAVASLAPHKQLLAHTTTA